MNKRKISIILLIFTSVLLGGCSKLWNTLECISWEDKYTIRVIWETNKRVLSESSKWGFRFDSKSDRNNRSNCGKTKEETPPKMLSWYEYASWYFK
jgi:hypothetical protein